MTDAWADEQVSSAFLLSRAERMTDAWEVQIHYPGDSWNDENANENLYGNLKALYLMKKKHRHLKSESLVLRRGHLDWRRTAFTLQ